MQKIPIFHLDTGNLIAGVNEAALAFGKYAPTMAGVAEEAVRITNMTAPVLNAASLHIDTGSVMSMVNETALSQEKYVINAASLSMDTSSLMGSMSDAVLTLDKSASTSAAIAGEAFRLVDTATPVWDMGVINAASLSMDTSSLMGAMNDAVLTLDKSVSTSAAIAGEAVRITNMAAPVWNAGVMNAVSLHDHARALMGTVNEAAMAFDKYAPTMAGVAEEAVRITNMAAPVWNAGVMNAASLHDHANAFVGTVNDAALAFDKYAPTLTKVAEETFRIVDTAASMRNASVINVAPLSMDMGSLLPSASTSLLMRDGYVVGMRAPSQVVPELWEPPADRETPMHSAVAGEISSLLPVLEMCDQALVGPWSGVVERIERRGPDWVRHAAVSAREVLIATLACAAPSSEVIEMGFADPQTGREMHGSEPTYLAMARFAKARLAHTDLGRDNDLQPDDVVRLIRAVQVLVHGRSGSRSEADAELLLPRVGRVTRLLVAIRHS